MASIYDYTKQKPPGFGTSDQMYQSTLAGYSNQLAAAQAGYNSISKGYKNLYNQQAGYGESQRLGLESQYARNLASAQGSMMSRGLYGTSAYDAATRGVQGDMYSNQLTLNDQLLQRRNQIQQAKFGYQAGGQQLLSGIRGSQNQYMGAAQQSRFGYEANAQQAYDQLGYQGAISENQLMLDQRRMAYAAMLAAGGTNFNPGTQWDGGRESGEKYRGAQAVTAAASAPMSHVTASFNPAVYGSSEGGSWDGQGYSDWGSGSGAAAQYGYDYGSGVDQWSGGGSWDEGGGGSSEGGDW